MHFNILSLLCAITLCTAGTPYRYDPPKVQVQLDEPADPSPAIRQPELTTSTSDAKPLIQRDPQNGFPTGAFSQGGFPQGGFPQGGFPQGAFPQGAFQQGAFPQTGFGIPPFVQQGLSNLQGALGQNWFIPGVSGQNSQGFPGQNVQGYPGQIQGVPGQNLQGFAGFGGQNVQGFSGQGFPGQGFPAQGAFGFSAANFPPQNYNPSSFPPTGNPNQGFFSAAGFAPNRPVFSPTETGSAVPGDIDFAKRTGITAKSNVDSDTAYDANGGYVYEKPYYTKKL